MTWISPVPENEYAENHDNHESLKNLQVQSNFSWNAQEKQLIQTLRGLCHWLAPAAVATPMLRYDDETSPDHGSNPSTIFALFSKWSGSIFYNIITSESDFYFRGLIMTIPCYFSQNPR